MPLLTEKRLDQGDFDADIILQDLRGLKIGSTESIDNVSVFPYLKKSRIKQLSKEIIERRIELSRIFGGVMEEPIR